MVWRMCEPFETAVEYVKARRAGVEIGKLEGAHFLKQDRCNFNAIMKGEKKCEARKDDRLFSVGDILILQETRYTGFEMATEGMPLEYTGREVIAEVTHIQRGYGLPDDVCVMSISVLFGIV